MKTFLLAAATMSLSTLSMASEIAPILSGTGHFEAQFDSSTGRYNVPWRSFVVTRTTTNSDGLPEELVTEYGDSFEYLTSTIFSEPHNHNQTSFQWGIGVEHNLLNDNGNIINDQYETGYADGYADGYTDDYVLPPNLIASQISVTTTYREDGYITGYWAGYDDRLAGNEFIGPTNMSFSYDVYDYSDNNLSFSANDFNNQIKGETFVAGTISYTNGAAFIGTSPDSVIFTLTSFGDSPDFNQQIELDIEIGTTPDEADGNALAAELAADYIFFPAFPEFGRLMVFEGETGTVEILAEFNSLHFQGFGNVLTSGVSFVAPLDQSVPEPESLWLLSLGLLSILGFKKVKYTV